MCKCIGCVNKNKHLTLYHKCDTCDDFGHGVYECPLNKNGDMTPLIEINNDEQNIDEIINMCDEKMCEIYGCDSPYSHVSKSHDYDYNKRNKNIKMLNNIEIEWCKSKTCKSCWIYINEYSWMLGIVNIIVNLNKSREKGYIYNSSKETMGLKIFGKKSDTDNIIEIHIFGKHDVEKQNLFIFGYKEIQ